jgi:hypothetical protein
MKNGGDFGRSCGYHYCRMNRIGLPRVGAKKGWFFSEYARMFFALELGSPNWVLY